MNVKIKSTDLEKYKIKPPPRDGSLTDRRAYSTSRGARVSSARPTPPAKKQKQELEEEIKDPLTERHFRDIARIYYFIS